MPPTPPADAAPGLIDRVQSFVSENRTALLVGAAVLAAGGAAYYASSSSSSSSSGAERKKKGSSKPTSGKKKPGAKSVKDADGPILEERKPKAVAEESNEDLEVVAQTPEALAAMSVDERKELAASYKTKGNTAYTSKKFAAAARLYTLAIEVSPKPEPVYYSNRAACYINMTPPLYDKVVEDCDEALKLDPNYVKALNRRAMALEGLQRHVEALRDFTAATILDKFTNQSASQSVERVLKKLTSAKATEILASREPRLPSYTFVSAYFAAFRPRAPPKVSEPPSTGDNTLLLALDALKAEDYPHALSLVNEALGQDISTKEARAEALNLRGTFRFLTGNVAEAQTDLQDSINLLPSFTQSLVKVASVHMEQGDPSKAFEAFDAAIAQNPDDPDIYYHRGQVLFIMNEFGDAAENYTKSTSLDDGFVFSHIQLAVAQYKSGNLANSMATFRRTLKSFPNRSEPQNYYGELLLDQSRFEEAVEKFEKAVELESNKPHHPNVLPLVNKGLAIYQWKQDLGAAERCCTEALGIDPECEAAVATLAQLSLQQGSIEKAVELFSRQADLARSEPELVSALTYRYASEAQLEFMKTYPGMAAELRAMAMAMS
ncbi:ADP/ATP carrier receptor [Mycena indigotica]|uniref:ADP/ATP carrier receptor n=1 Tax=Mycena indigotica TaxID=2126181 RepID=A0A8H6RZV0_9AGAR|nr:ADP/ATP carrier receptor [Mycena indigotica]KAF7290750.1 ADP/ATP carrier receptor [Mycena indigotica]